MANKILEQLLPASFNGVAFSVTSESIPKAGRKIIVHEFVNSDDQEVEDQGKIPPNFTVRAFIHSSKSGAGPNKKLNDDFIERSNAFQEALNTKGRGILVLPTLGSFSVFAGAYKIDASQKSVGEISFNIPFYAGKPEEGPARGKLKNKQGVFEDGDNARKNLGETISAFLKKSISVTDSIVAASDLDNILESIKKAVSPIIPVDGISDLLKTIEAAQLNVNNLINNPTILGDVMFTGTPFVESIWQQISVGTSSAIEQSTDSSNVSAITDAFIFLTNIGASLSLSIPEIQRDFLIDPISRDIPIWPETTAERINRNTTRQNIAQANRVAALVVLYEIVAARNYNSDNEIIETRTIVENIHEEMMRIESSDRNLIQSDVDVRKTVEDVRIASLNVLEQKEQESFIIQEEGLRAPTSALVHAYSLYAEEFTDAESLSSRSRTLAQLNTSQPSDRMIGDIKILQVANG